MEIKFYRCTSCNSLDEYKRLIKSRGCVCGGKRVRPSAASSGDLIWFCIKHPSYLYKAIMGDKLYE